MKNKVLFLLILLFTLASVLPVNLPAKAQQQENLQTKLNQIVVNPGGLQRIGLADFLLRTGSSEADVNTFNEVLLNDLKFAGVIDVVGKSLYPKKGLANPAELKVEDWNADPARLDYLAFG